MYVDFNAFKNALKALFCTQGNAHKNLISYTSVISRSKWGFLTFAIILTYITSGTIGKFLHTTLIISVA